MRLAEMIRLYLAANNFSQKQAAEEIGISESTISRFLSGELKPDADNYMRVLSWCSSVKAPVTSGMEDRIRALEERTTIFQRIGGIPILRD